MAGYVRTSVLGFTGEISASDAVAEGIIRDYIRAQHGVAAHDAASPQQLIDAFTQGMVDYALEVVQGYRREVAKAAAEASVDANPPEWED